MSIKVIIPDDFSVGKPGCRLVNKDKAILLFCKGVLKFPLLILFLRPEVVFLFNHKVLNRCPFHKLPGVTEFDTLDPAARENPWPYYDWLRSNSENGVYRLPQEENFFIVHRYEDVKNIFADAENFSSTIVPTQRPVFAALTDGEDHARIREVMSEIFHQKNILSFESQLRDVIRKATSKLATEKIAELFEVWANVIPLATLSVIFGFEVNEARLKKLHADSIAINRAFFVTGGTGPRRSSDPSFFEKIRITTSVIRNAGKLLRLRKLAGRKGMRELRQMLNITRKNIPTPRPSFEHIPGAVSPMLDLMLLFANGLKDQNNINGSFSIFREAIKKNQATFMEMVMTGAFIFFAGYETTSSLLSNSVVHLARNPGLFQKLKSNPELLEDFIEEALRFYTPVGRFLRRANHDLEINGTTIPKDSIIILMSGAANTDPDKFVNGCAFDINRENNRQHLSFGKGAHFCVGAPLARMQVTMALKELIQKATSLELIHPEKMKMVTDRDNGILRYEKIIVKVGQ